MSTPITTTQALASFGLDPKETKTYTALLCLGDSNVTDLSARTKFGRSTLYKILDRLTARQLVTSYRTSAGLRFVPTQPKTLLEQTAQTFQELKSVLPDLEALDSTSPKKKNTKVQVFYGALGYRTAIEDSLHQPNTTLRHIGSLGEIHEIKTKHHDLHYYMPKRIKNNIFLRSLYFADTPDEISNVDQHKFLRDIRYLPEKYKYRGATLVYGDTTLITSSTDTIVTIMIKNEAIADAEIKKFDLLWELVGPNKKQHPSQ